MAEFVMNGNEVLTANLQTNLDAQIILVVEIPCAGVTDDIAICRFSEKRSSPEGFRQWNEAHRGEKSFAVLHHAFGVKILGPKQRAQIIVIIAFRQPQEGVDVPPLLRP